MQVTGPSRSDGDDSADISAAVHGHPPPPGVPPTDDRGQRVEASPAQPGGSHPHLRRRGRPHLPGDQVQERHHSPPGEDQPVARPFRKFLHIFQWETCRMCLMDCPPLSNLKLLLPRDKREERRRCADLAELMCAVVAITVRGERPLTACCMFPIPLQGIPLEGKASKSPKACCS